jgi:hypothetical protein
MEKIADGIRELRRGRARGVSSVGGGIGVDIHSTDGGKEHEENGPLAFGS